MREDIDSNKNENSVNKEISMNRDKSRQGKGNHLFSATMTIQEALVEASSFLAAQGIADGRSDAELLIQHMLGWERSRLLLDWREIFPGKYAEQWTQLLQRRATGEPVQYMLGEQEFYGLPFEVNPAVLIPRPETELLVEAITKHGRELFGGEAGQGDVGESVARENAVTESTTIGSSLGEQADKGNQANDNSANPSLVHRPFVVDIGTGSGAIAVSLAAFNPSWRLLACDLSEQAIEVATRNTEKNGFAGRITFCQGNLLEPAIELGLRIDILVSNPPYIPSPDIPTLQREVREHEPMLALDGGEDGLYCYRTLLEQMQQLPVIPLLVGFEVGFGQAQEVAELMRKRGWWQQIEIIKDYAGIERHVIGMVSWTGEK